MDQFTVKNQCKKKARTWRTWHFSYSEEFTSITPGRLYFLHGLYMQCHHVRQGALQGHFRQACVVRAHDKHYSRPMYQILCPSLSLTLITEYGDSYHLLLVHGVKAIAWTVTVAFRFRCPAFKAGQGQSKHMPEGERLCLDLVFSTCTAHQRQCQYVGSPSQNISAGNGLTSAMCRDALRHLSQAPGCHPYSCCVLLFITIFLSFQPQTMCLALPCQRSASNVQTDTTHTHKHTHTHMHMAYSIWIPALLTRRNLGISLD